MTPTPSSQRLTELLMSASRAPLDAMYRPSEACEKSKGRFERTRGPVGRWRWSLRTMPAADRPPERPDRTSATQTCSLALSVSARGVS